MEPLSVVASTASLLGLSIRVSGILYGTWINSKSPGAQRLLFELSNLRAILQDFEATVLKIDTPLALSPLPDIYENCRRILEALERKTGSDSRGVRWNWRVFEKNREARKWFLSPLETVRIINELQQDLKLLLRCLESLHSEVHVRDISGKTLPSDTTDDAELADRVPRELVPRSSQLWRLGAEYSSVHMDISELRVKGIGSWVLDHLDFHSWYKSGGRKNVLWCTGLPGSGKSMLVSLIIDHLKDGLARNSEADTGLAFFYFRQTIRTTVCSVVIALLDQLYTQTETIASEVQTLVSRTLDTHRITLIEAVTCLLAVAGRFRRTYIIIDAVDECCTADQGDLLYFLEALRHSGTRLFTTSRRLETIERALTSDSTVVIEIQYASREIKRFIEVSIDENASWNQLLDRTLREMVTKTIAENSHESFLLASLQLKKLMTSLQQKALVSDAPINMQSELESLPKDVFDVYSEEMHRILNQDGKAPLLARATFSWLIRACRPLDPAELLDILKLAVSDENINLKDALNACFPLVINDSSVHILHVSLYDFLVIPPIASRILFSEDVLAKQCLTYLLMHSPAEPVRKAESLLERHSVRPFYSYASCYWGRYVRKGVQESSAPESLITQTIELLSNYSVVQTSACVLFRDSHEKHSHFRSSPTHLAAYFGLDWAISKSLAFLGDMDDADSLGRTPLHLAGEQGFAECIRLLLPHYNVADQDSFGKTVLHYATMRGHEEVVRLLLESGCLAGVINVPDNEGKMPLVYAAECGHLSVLGILLSAFPEPPQGALALRSAIKARQVNTVNRLLSGIKPEYEHLQLAVESNVEDLVRILYRYGVDLTPATKDQRSAVQLAARTGNVNILRFLLENGADLESPDALGRTALSFAVEEGRSSAVKYLLRLGVSPEALIDKDTTAIMHAASNGTDDILQMLLEYGAYPDTAMVPAVRGGHSRSVRILLERGGDPTVKDEEGRSLLECARENENFDIVELLEEKIRKPSVMETPEIADGKSETLDGTDVDSPRASDPPKLELVQPNSPDDSSPPAATTPLSPAAAGALPGLLLDRPTMKAPARKDSQSSNRPTWILLRDFLPMAALSSLLGAIVLEVLDPLSCYVPKDSKGLQKLISSFGSPATSVKRDVRWERGSSLRGGVFATALQSKHELALQSTKHELTAVDQLTTYQLPNQPAVFAALVKAYSQEIQNILRESGKIQPQVYFVTGIMTVKGYKDNLENKRTLCLPILKEAWMSRGGSTGKEYFEEMVYAIQCRVVRHKSLFKKDPTLKGYSSVSSSHMLH